MNIGLANVSHKDVIIRKPEKSLCKIESWPSYRRSNAEMMRQKNARKTMTRSAYSNHRPIIKTRRKRSERRKPISQMKSIYFSTHSPCSLEVPESIAKAKLERKNLAHIKSNLQTELKAIEQLISISRSRLLDFHSECITQITSLTECQTELLSFKNDLFRLVGLKIKHAAEVYERLTCFESQRKSLIEKMANPNWNKQHCFYMLALERFRENKQVKQIIQIAEAMSGNIALTAVAHHSIEQHMQTITSYQNLMVDRSLLEEMHSAVTKKLQIFRFSLSEYESFLLTMKKKISRKDKEKIRKAERVATVEKSQSLKSFPKSETLCWRFKHRLSGDTVPMKEDDEEDDEAFWQNVNVQEFIRYLDEHLNEFDKRFAFTKTENTAYKLFYEFQHDPLNKFSGESFQFSQCSDYSHIYGTYNSTPGCGSSIVTTSDPKKVDNSLTPIPTVSNRTSISELEFPAAFYSVGVATVETARSLAGDGQQMHDHIDRCNIDRKALHGILETISAARNDHKSCSSNLKMITMKIEELELEISNYVPNNREMLDKKCASKNWAAEVTEQKNFKVSCSAQENDTKIT